MTRTSPDTVFRQIAANKRAPQKVRLAALQAIVRPSLAYLARLAADADNPVKIRLAAAQRLDAALLLRAKLKENRAQGNRTQANRD
jgi:hypothetical protein